MKRRTIVLATATATATAAAAEAPGALQAASKDEERAEVREAAQSALAAVYKV